MIIVDSSIATAKSGRITHVGNSGTVGVGEGIEVDVDDDIVGVGLEVDIEVGVGVGFENGVVVIEPSVTFIVSMLLQPPA